MEITGYLKNITDPIEKVSKKGNTYQIATMVVETQEMNPNSMCFELIGSQLSELIDIGIGNLVKVTYLCHVEHWNGKYYNSFKVTKVERQIAYKSV